MPIERHISVKSQHVRKATPGLGRGDLMKSTKDDWREVVDFSVSDNLLITFSLAGGGRRQVKYGQLVSIKRMSED